MSHDTEIRRHMHTMVASAERIFDHQTAGGWTAAQVNALYDVIKAERVSQGKANSSHTAVLTTLGAR